MILSFGDYEIDVERRELRRAKTLVHVEPQVFDLLVYLVENRDRVVSKDDLIASVWGGRIVSDSTLTSRINAARTAVGDSGKQQRLIRTVPRKGVRFVGDVGEVPQFIETLPGGTSYHIIKIRSDAELDNTPVFHVPPGHYFAMGDNRDNSSDSRIAPGDGGVGFIPAVNLEGRAEILFFSTNGTAHWWQVWLWPDSLRFARFFKPVGGGA